MSTAIRPKPKKPYPDFPLFAHATGYWAKKIRQRLFYFGRWDDPDAALAKYLDQRDDLHAGRTPRALRGELTVSDLCNRFCTAKERQRDSGDLTHRSFVDYFRTAKRLVDSFGRNRLVTDLAADDFEALRSSLAKQYGVQRLGCEIQRVRVICKYALDANLIEQSVRIGPTFKKPTMRLMRAHRQANGLRMFEAAELRKILDAANQPLKAMILLGVNCGFGNHDCGTLPKTAVDLETGWVNYPRPKTAIDRRCPLWPETVEAVRLAFEQRPKAEQHQHAGLAFLTPHGKPWAKVTPESPVGEAFRRLLNRLNLHRRGVGFYALRHTFETIGGESRDQVAVNHVMGHADATMAGVYRERISDDRLRDVVNHVRDWLFDTKETK